MPILPVLDLMNGQIVRGIAGQRATYRPITSNLVDSAEPIAVAQAFQTHFGFTEFYLADLDAIQHQRPAFAVYQQLHQEGFRLWIDAGVHSIRDEVLSLLLGQDATDIVIGLESVAGPTELQHITQHAGEDRIIFSLDLKAGQLLGQLDSWETADPWKIAETAIVTQGVRRLIVLDLARVGVGGGVGTEELCARLKTSYPYVQLTAGGGIRNAEDVRRLSSLGVDYVLVASALHDGRLTHDDVTRINPG